MHPRSMASFTSRARENSKPASLRRYASQIQTHTTCSREPRSVARFAPVNEQGEPKVLSLREEAANEQGEPKVLPVTSFLRLFVAGPLSRPDAVQKARRRWQRA